MSAEEFKVGQSISGVEYDRLPVGAKFRRGPQYSEYEVTETGFKLGMADTTLTAADYRSARKITYLPDATEPEDKDDLYVEPEPLKEGEEDERIGAWERVSDHPIFRPCYAEERPLIDAVMAKLDRIYSEGASPMRPEEPDVLGAVVYSESNGKFWTRASIDPEESHVWAGAYDKCWFNWRQLPDDVVVWDPADPARGGAS